MNNDYKEIFLSWKKPHEEYTERQFRNVVSDFLCFSWSWRKAVMRSLWKSERSSYTVGSFEIKNMCVGKCEKDSS